MSILSPQIEEVFTIRIYKSVDIASDQVWSNTYELQNYGGATLTDLNTAATRLVAFEKAIHHDTAAFRRRIISTYVPDGEPYDPFSFVSATLSGNGEIASPAAAAVLPLQVALFVRRDTATGRAGKLMYRMCLGEGDVQGRFGTISLSSPAGFVTLINDELTSSLVTEMLGSPPVFPLGLVMASGSPDPTIVRPVEDLIPVGARIIKYNNRYFDVP